MNKLVLSTILLGVIALLPSGCTNKPKQENELVKLVNTLSDKHGVYDVEIARKIQAYGEEAIPLMLDAVFNRPKQQQLAYAHVLYRIDAEPARFHAIKKIVQEHPDDQIRTFGVAALTRLNAPKEAIDYAIELTKHEHKGIRESAYNSLRYVADKTRIREVCSVLRRGLGDPEQMVRETAQRSIDHLRDHGIACP